MLTKHSWDVPYISREMGISYIDLSKYFCKNCNEKGTRSFIVSVNKILSDTDFCEEFLLKQIIQ